MLNEDTHLQRATKNKGVKAILHIAIERRKHSLNGFCCLANGIAIKKCCVLFVVVVAANGIEFHAEELKT